MSLNAPDEPSSRKGNVPGNGPLIGGASHGIEAFALVAGIARGENASVQLARSPVDALPPYVVLKRPREGKDDAALRVEASALAQVQSPHVVRAFELGRGPLPYLVLEYVEGLSLREIVDLERGERRIRFVIPAMIDALRGLQTLHARGLFHQAPCLRHIMVGVDGRTKLIDLAHAAGPGLALQDAGLVPSEMAPEQVIAPENVDARCDIFIAAVSLWEALTGQRPFVAGRGEQTVQELLRAPIVPPSKVVANCPPHFDRLLERALQRAPWKRFASAAEMADALEEIARRHGLLASREETAVWLRVLIARATDARTPQRPSVRAVANRTGISAFGATPQQPAGSLPLAAVPAPASRPAREPFVHPTETIEIAPTLALIDAFPELPSVDDDDTFVPPTPRRSRAANVLGVLLSAAVLVAGGVALRERMTPPRQAPAPIILESHGPRAPELDLTMPEPVPARVPSTVDAQPPSPPAPSPNAPAATRTMVTPTAAKAPAPKPLMRRPLPKPTRATPAATKGPAPGPAPAWKGGAAPSSPLQTKPVAATPWMSGEASTTQPATH